MSCSLLEEPCSEEPALKEIPSRKTLRWTVLLGDCFEEHRFEENTTEKNTAIKCRVLFRGQCKRILLSRESCAEWAGQVHAVLRTLFGEEPTVEKKMNLFLGMLM